jgi:hypothetical protein
VDTCWIVPVRLPAMGRAAKSLDVRNDCYAIDTRGQQTPRTGGDEVVGAPPLEEESQSSVSPISLAAQSVTLGIGLLGVARRPPDTQWRQRRVARGSAGTRRLFARCATKRTSPTDRIAERVLAIGGLAASESAAPAALADARPVFYSVAGGPVPGLTSPDWYAAATALARSRTPSFIRMRPTCVLTVPSPMMS